jgi:hypothetical protein
VFINTSGLTIKRMLDVKLELSVMLWEAWDIIKMQGILSEK